MQKPPYEELEGDLKKFLNPAQPKALLMLAKGVAPLPPLVLVPAWVYLSDHADAEISSAAQQSLKSFPEASLKSALALELPAWALFKLTEVFKDRDDFVEVILLNENCPVETCLALAATCSERISSIIANNQEKIIEAPELILELEKNPQNLKSSTDRLRHFLRLAGVHVPGDSVSAKQEQPKEEQEKAAEEVPKDDEELTEEKRVTLTQYITTLSVGAKVKLALKGNKEARTILIKDSNKIVACMVLKSPKVTEPEVVLYSNFKSLAEDVVRNIANNPNWTKNYNIKLNLVNHPKVPLQSGMAFLKFLNFRDLQTLSKSKTVLGPLRKAAKELFMQKRK